MKPLTANDPETKTPDIVAENVEQLKALFPEAFTEGKVDFEVLKQLLGGAVEEREEKYGLTWHGKRRARQLALTPSTGTLRPCPQDSVGWDTTDNLMIEGDNLEVLKLLQKSYARKVKMIYIDPPYNTGGDFVYPDDFQDNIKNYLMRTGQLESDGRKNTSNSDASGRFHTDWLNMIYPRLRLAMSLLRDDGVIFISIDDTEVSNLRHVCDDLFGPENFIAEIIWESAGKNDARQIGINHEYIVVFAKNRNLTKREWSVAKVAVEPILREVERLKKQCGDNYDAASEAMANWYKANKSTPSYAHRRYRYIDKNGLYKEENPTQPGGRKFDLKNPFTGETIKLTKGRGWGFDQKQFEELVNQGRISFISSDSIMLRLYLHETDRVTPQSVLYQPTRSASERLAKLLGATYFDFPKDETVIQTLIEMASERDDIVMDFFAGSGTTAHAVFAQNALDKLNRRFVLVQLPEPLDADNNEQKLAAKYCDELGRPRTIAELTKERLRRAGKKIREENPMFHGDLGFRVFKLDSTNIRAWEPNRDDLPTTLHDSIEHLKTDRTEQDILFELLLKLGLDLTIPIEQKSIAGKAVHNIGAGTLLVCLAAQIGSVEVEPLAQGIVAWHKALAPAGETTVVFRDSAFADDMAKTNLSAILQQHELDNVRSL
jgi:adenine-specific DNA-methyltransferase